MKDELWIKFTEPVDFEGQKADYLQIMISSNPPADPHNAGCLGLYVYSADDLDYDIGGGELDYPSDTIDLEFVVDRCLEFLDIDAMNYEICDDPS